jgi:hypothetical protein
MTRKIAIIGFILSLIRQNDSRKNTGMNKTQNKFAADFSG